MRCGEYELKVHESAWTASLWALSLFFMRETFYLVVSTIYLFVCVGGGYMETDLNYSNLMEKQNYRLGKTFNYLS